MKMAFQKFMRGQVWIAELPENLGGCVQEKTRPIVITSNDIGNYESTIVNGVAVTSQTRYDLPINVKFMNGKAQNTILCNQIFTLPHSRMKHYMFTLTDEVMDKVSKALAISQGIDIQYPSLEIIEEVMTKFLETKIAQCKNDMNKLNDDKILQIAENLKTILDKESTKLSKEPDKVLTKEVSVQTRDSDPEIHSKSVAYEPSIPTSPSFVAESSKPSKSTDFYEYDRDKKCLSTISDHNKELFETKVAPKSEKSKKTTATRRPSGYWNVDRMKEFIADKDTMPISEVREKWDISSNKTVVDYYYQFNSKLRKLNN